MSNEELKEYAEALLKNVFRGSARAPTWSVIIDGRVLSLRDSKERILAGADAVLIPPYSDLKIKENADEPS